MVGKRYGLDCTRTDPFWIDFPSAVTDPFAGGTFLWPPFDSVCVRSAVGCFFGFSYHTEADLDDCEKVDPTRGGPMPDETVPHVPCENGSWYRTLPLRADIYIFFCV